MIDFNVISKVILMLSITLVAMVLLIFILKKFKKMMPVVEGNLQIISGAQLSNKSKIVLVEAKNTQILLGVTDANIQTLYVFNTQDKPVGMSNGV